MSFLLRSNITKKISTDTGKGIQTPLSASERAFPASGAVIKMRLSVRASLTIEAAAGLPLFIFFTVCMLHFFLLLSLETNIQTHLNAAAKSMSREIYMSPLLSYGDWPQDIELSDIINSSRISGGTGGFHTSLSSYDQETGELDLCASYTYIFPYLPESIASLNILQRSACRAWIGSPLNKQTPSEGGDSEKRIVYITPAGSAWHAAPSCSYLDLSIHAVSFSSVNSLRNLSGSRYTGCKCYIPGSSFVYITDYGTQYHSDAGCSSLKRTVMAVDISEVGERHPCSKCASGE